MSTDLAALALADELEATPLTDFGSIDISDPVRRELVLQALESPDCPPVFFALRDALRAGQESVCLPSL